MLTTIREKLKARYVDESSWLCNVYSLKGKEPNLVLFFSVCLFGNSHTQKHGCGVTAFLKKQRTKKQNKKTSDLRWATIPPCLAAIHSCRVPSSVACTDRKWVAGRHLSLVTSVTLWGSPSGTVHYSVYIVPLPWGQISGRPPRIGKKCGKSEAMNNASITYVH